LTSDKHYVISRYSGGTANHVTADPKMKKTYLVILSLVATVAAGCTELEHKSSLTDPSIAGNNSLLGNWTSSTLIPTPSTCTDFKWNVTEQTPSSMKGTFSASCPGDLKFTGNAEGSLTSPTNIRWSAAANATAPGLSSCSLNLTGTATLGTDSIIVPYEGTTCLGAVKGIETLKKH
jgi:hypothetical protein